MSSELGKDSVQTKDLSQCQEDQCQEDEVTPFTSQNKNDSSTTDKQPFLQKFRQNAEYRNKVVSSFGLIFSFSMLGWVVGQIGPSFLDLQIITNTSLDKASAYFTSGSIGYLIGSLVFGLVFDKVPFEKILVVFFTDVGSAIILAILPWCLNYELMIFIHIWKGFFGGGIDTTGNAYLLFMWGNDGKSFMQALHFAFAFGGILSPFAMAPFLAPQEDVTYQNLVVMPENVTNYPVMNQTLLMNYDQNYSLSVESSTMSIEGQTDMPESRLYIAYSISAALSLLTAIPLFGSYIVTRKISKKKKAITNKEKEDKDAKTSDDIPVVLKFVTLICLMLLLGAYCAVEDAFNSFLSTFCVKHMKWTKFQGAAITAVFWAFFAVGRFLGIFLIMFFKPVRMIFFLCVSLILSFTALVITALYTTDVGIWISASCVGLAMSVFFPSVFTWTEEAIFPVNGRVASCFLISASAGSMINPIVLGVLMEKISPMIFPYLLLSETVLLLFVFILALYLSKKIKSVKSKVKEIEIEVTSDFICDKDQNDQTVL